MRTPVNAFSGNQATRLTNALLNYTNGHKTLTGGLYIHADIYPDMTAQNNQEENIDYSRHTLEVECSWCLQKTVVTFLQIANEETILCKCGKEIRLVDEDGSMKKLVEGRNGRSE